MIRFRTAIRLYPAVWLAPVLVLVCVWYARSMVFRVDPEPYLPGLSSQPVTTQGLVAPIVAALAAWEAGRLRRGGVWSFPIMRRRIVVLAWPLGLIWLAGFVAVAAGVWTVLLAKGFVFPDVRPLAVAAVVIGAHTLAGFAFGLSLPIVIAAPVAMGVSLLWQVMPRAIEPLWTHLLTSQQLETCCSTDTDIGLAALAAPILVALGVAGAAAIVSFLRRSPATAVMAAAVLIAGLTAGSVVASSQPRGDVGVGRDETSLVCSESGPEVCVWPEHVSRLGEVREIVREAAAAWAAVGLSVPARFDEAGLSAPREDVMHFRFSLASSQDQIVGSMAYEMVPGYIDCPGAYVAYVAFEPLYAWYAATAGMSADGLAIEFGPLPVFSDDVHVDVLTLVKEVRSLPAFQQRDWVLRNTWALGACDRPADLRPAGP